LIVFANRYEIPLEEVFQSHKKTFGTLFEGLGSFPNRPENPLFVPPGGGAAPSRRLPSIKKEISSVIRGARHLRGAASPPYFIRDAPASMPAEGAGRIACS